MSLKRKASFPTQPSPFASCGMDIDNSKHLNSRTLKRFRNGRPDDEVVYACQVQANMRAEKTLRWIFSAQQQQHSGPMDTSDEPMEDATLVPTPEEIDPRQQTLLRFFQPRGQQVPRFKPSREALVPLANEIVMNQEDSIRRAAFEQMAANTNSSGSETTSPGFNSVDMDMDMDMDIDTNESSPSSNPASNPGGMTWM
ncbi:hypothetical protein N7493_010662 [Penicillium malachiteum]|uniref:Uncharacterized protein n=1 Tax=Penicillium malachiteum TaxID=1324776 RepID=A0AAD6MRW3_9EURO|nr:hypothetical protein N7493_010662 [Penicillium malachiteum]